MSRKVAKNSFWNFGSQGILSLVNFLIIPMLLMGLGDVGFGLFRVLGLLSITGYAAVLELGLQGSVSKFTAQYIAEKRFDKVGRLFGTAFSIFIVIGIVGALAGWSLLSIWPKLFNVPPEMVNDFKTCVAVIFVGYFFAFPTLALNGFLQGVQRFDALRAVDLTAQLFRAGTFVVLLKSGFGLVEIVISMVIIQVVQFFATLFCVMRIPEFRFGRFSRETLKEIRHMLGINILGRIYGLAFSQADVLIIASILGPRAVAAYEIATKVPFVIKATLGRVGEVLVPAASELHSQARPESLERLFRRAVRMEVLIAFPLVVGLLFLAPDFLRLWVGPQPEEVVLAFRIALIMILVYPPLSVGSAMLMGMGARLNLASALNFGSSLFNVIVTLAVIKSMGIPGAVLATLASFVVLTIGYIPLLVRDLKISVFTTIRDVGSVGALSALAWIVWTLSISRFGLASPNLSFTTTTVSFAIVFAFLYLSFFALILDPAERKVILRKK